MSLFRSRDLFAGIGGIRLGFEQAFGDALDTVYVSEWDSSAQITYRSNFTDSFPISGDITAVSVEDVPSHDFLLAGFPCQSFSIAGGRRGFEDTRGTLFFDLARIADFHKPKLIFAENVKGLLSHNGGRTFEVIIGTLVDLGYSVFYEVLNSKDFDVPQNRERVYIVAFRKDISPRGFKFPDSVPSTKSLRDILEDSVDVKYFLSEERLEGLLRHKRRHWFKGNGFGFVVRDLDTFAGAVTCGDTSRNLIVDDRFPKYAGVVNEGCYRSLTPREWARLQGFPESFVLPVSDSQLYKQLGNSVTVPVVRSIAGVLRDYLV